MLTLLKTCFPEHYTGWEPALRELIPTYGEKLNENEAVADESMTATAAALGISR
jgi:malate dehydrogenase (quinone)